ncbi:MAG: hypothetical protein COA78_25290 [Blastopirellula sp.]|nr:MAG: hypothetical protein COA78_25290 [Blastopirellula sp.]
MATASQVLKAALQSILVQASEAPLEPDEYQDTIFAMNNFMFALASDGVNLGYTEVADLGDEITIPTGALRGLIANVAVEMSSEFGGVISEALAMRAISGLKTMLHLGISLGPSAMPSTLPTGSGNYNEFSCGAHFYPDMEATILAEAAGTIGLETGTT